MRTANVNDPASVEVIYSRDDFEADARQNARDKTEVRHGVMILSKPDSGGVFNLTRANRQVGEDRASTHSVFVCPFLDSADYGAFIQDDTDYGGPSVPARAPRDPADAYRAFVERVIEAARTADFPPAPPPEALAGFHGG